MRFLLEGAAGLTVLALIALAMKSLAAWLLAPLTGQSANVSLPRTFQLSDFFWLMVQLQLALGGCVTWVGVDSRSFPAITGLVLLLVTALWAGAVSWLSRTGVGEPRRRAAFVLVLMPLALAILIALPFPLAGVAMSVYEWKYGSRSSGSSLGWWLSVALALPIISAATAFLLRWLARWIAQGLPQSSAEPPAAPPTSAASPAASPPAP